MSDLNIISATQQDAEWFEARLGCLTASRIADALAKRKGKSTEDLQCRADLRLALSVERVTNKPMENYVSKWMERGTEMEPLARAAYEIRTGNQTQQVGFVAHPSIEWAGCSPDGLVGDDGLVELKAPKSTTHAEYLLGECVPEIYVPQMMFQMACCPARKWNDFVSYCPDFPAPLDVFIARLNRDNQRIAVMEAEAIVFLKETADLTLRLTHGLEGMLRQSLVPRAIIPPPDEFPEDLSHA